MTEIHSGDRVRFLHNESGGKISGVVTELYVSAGEPAASIDYGAKHPFHQAVRLLELCDVRVQCAGPDCSAAVLAKPRSRYYCPDHLDHVFNEPAGAGDGLLVLPGEQPADKPAPATPC